MYVGKNTFCFAECAAWGTPAGKARWGEEERCQRLRTTNGSPRQSGIRDDEAVRGEK